MIFSVCWHEGKGARNLSRMNRIHNNNVEFQFGPESHRHGSSVVGRTSAVIEESHFLLFICDTSVCHVFKCATLSLHKLEIVFFAHLLFRRKETRK